jgi:DNA-binding MarR family transcriptional regulator
MQTDRKHLFRKYLRILEREMQVRTKCDTPCCGVTVAQCHVLLEIEEAGAASISGLAESLGLDSSSLSRTVDGLVEIGYASRTENAKDRRYTSIGLTESGKKIVTKINNTFDAAFSSVFDNVPKSDHDVIIDAIKTIALTLAGSRNPGCCDFKESKSVSSLSD